MESLTAEAHQVLHKRINLLEQDREQLLQVATPDRPPKSQPSSTMLMPTHNQISIPMRAACHPPAAASDGRSRRDRSALGPLAASVSVWVEGVGRSRSWVRHSDARAQQEAAFHEGAHARRACTPGRNLPSARRRWKRWKPRQPHTARAWPRRPCARHYRLEPPCRVLPLPLVCDR